MAREEWLDPWSDQFHTHSQPIREAIKSKDPQQSLQAIHEHLPEMIAIRDEVASLPIPNGFQPGLFGQLMNLITGTRNSELLDAGRRGTLQAWDEAIGDYRRELRRLETVRR